MTTKSREPLYCYTMTGIYLHLVQTHQAIYSSSIKAIKRYGHSVVIMDEE